MGKEYSYSPLANFAPPPLPQVALPPLPPIDNPDIQKKVFTHTSLHHKPRRATSLEYEDELLDNEKLEHVGDALLGSAVTVLLSNLFPELKVGPATWLKAQLVRDSFLFQISNRYNLPARLLADPNALLTLRKNEKTVASLFEAYIAGLFQSYLTDHKSRVPTSPRTLTKRGADDALDEVDESSRSNQRWTNGQAVDKLEDWLHALYTPLAHWVLDEMKMEESRLQSLNVTAEPGGMDEEAVGAMALLNQHCINNEGGIPHYDTQAEEGGMWTATVVATCKDGSKITMNASRNTKKQASTIAAYKILRQLGV